MNIQRIADKLFHVWTYSFRNHKRAQFVNLVLLTIWLVACFLLVSGLVVGGLIVLIG